MTTQEDLRRELERKKFFVGFAEWLLESYVEETGVWKSDYEYWRGRIDEAKAEIKEPEKKLKESA